MHVMMETQSQAMDAQALAMSKSDGNATEGLIQQLMSVPLNAEMESFKAQKSVMTTTLTT